MAPRILCDDGSSQPPYGSKGTSARTQPLRQLSLRQAPSLLRRPRHHTSWVPKSLRLPHRHVLREGWPRGDEDETGARLEPLASLSRVDACNPLLQAHPTWTRDEHEGRGIPTSLTPVSGRLALPPSRSPSRSTHLGWDTRRHSLVGPEDPRSRNADNQEVKKKKYNAQSTRQPNDHLFIFLALSHITVHRVQANTFSY
jgi:hypothetical protein